MEANGGPMEDLWIVGMCKRGAACRYSHGDAMTAMRGGAQT